MYSSWVRYMYIHLKVFLMLRTKFMRMSMALSDSFAKLRVDYRNAWKMSWHIVLILYWVRVYVTHILASFCLFKIFIQGFSWWMLHLKRPYFWRYSSFMHTIIVCACCTITCNICVQMKQQNISAYKHLICYFILLTDIRLFPISFQHRFRRYGGDAELAPNILRFPDFYHIYALWFAALLRFQNRRTVSSEFRQCGGTKQVAWFEEVRTPTWPWSLDEVPNWGAMRRRISNCQQLEHVRRDVHSGKVCWNHRLSPCILRRTRDQIFSCSLQWASLLLCCMGESAGKDLHAWNAAGNDEIIRYSGVDITHSCR